MVTLYMSVWIEIDIDLIDLSNALVTLYMSVWIEITFHNKFLAHILVTLYMSVWIEIFELLNDRMNRRHTLYECVD